MIVTDNTEVAFIAWAEPNTYENIYFCFDIKKCNLITLYSHKTIVKHWCYSNCSCGRVVEDWATEYKGFSTNQSENILKSTVLLRVTVKLNVRYDNTIFLQNSYGIYLLI